MKKKTPRTRQPLSPVAQDLPPGIAASLGRMIARHSYLDWLLANILCALLSIPIKQGRVAIKIPPPRLYIATVADLLALLRLHLPFNLDALERKLLAADQARYIFGHAVFLRDERTGKLCVQPVGGVWDIEHDVEAARKGLKVETIEVTRAFLAGQRTTIEEAITATRQLAERVQDGLQALNETRRTRRAMDRRSDR